MSRNALIVEPSPIHGQGLFAVVDFQPGQHIGVYESRPVDSDGIHVLWVEQYPGGPWQGYQGTNELRFMNHSASPNAELDGLDCYALHSIPAGTEITIDYGWDDS